LHLVLSQQGFKYDVVRNKKALEERTTGAAKASGPNKKKEIYEKRRIAVFLSGFSLMRVDAGKPGLLYIETMSHSLPCFHVLVVLCGDLARRQYLFSQG
jgi:hypothetical protein